MAKKNTNIEFDRELYEDCATKLGVWSEEHEKVVGTYVDGKKTVDAASNRKKVYAMMAEHYHEEGNEEYAKYYEEKAGMKPKKGTGAEAPKTTDVSKVAKLVKDCMDLGMSMEEAKAFALECIKTMSK